MGGKSNPNRLIVEGYDDLQSVAALMGAHTPWDHDKNRAPVWIEIGGSPGEILADGYLGAQIKAAAVKTLGVMFDGDTKPGSRYQRVLDLCKQFFPDMPGKLPAEGLIVENDTAGSKRLGVWIMPDNAAEGDLEMFLKYLVPDGSKSAWQHAVKSVKAAREEVGCAYRDAHLTKAELYTWLAWQDPPGQSPGSALTQNILDPFSGSAGIFVKWFRALYKL